MDKEPTKKQVTKTKPPTFDQRIEMARQKATEKMQNRVQTLQPVLKGTASGFWRQGFEAADAIFREEIKKELLNEEEPKTEETNKEN